MTNYNNSKIYKIKPICEHDEGEIYIGSTNRQNLSTRMIEHKYQYKRWKKGLRTKTMCFDIFDKYCINNVEIILIESVNANNKNELLEREAYYIKTLKCVNKNIPNRTKKEYRTDNQDKIYSVKKIYNEKNKEKIKKQKQNYYIQNRENILEQKKLYRANLKLKKTIEI